MQQGEGTARRGTVALRWAGRAMVAFALLSAAIAVVDPASADRPASRGQRAWLGVELKRGPGGGVLLAHVVRGSPAAAAGLVDGDVVTSVDGQAVDDPQQVVARVALLGPGRQLTLHLRRPDGERDARVQLGSFPSPDDLLRLDRVGAFAPAWQPTVPVAGVFPVDLASLRGRVVVLDFWATWCGPCRLTVPVLSKWHATYGAQGLTVVGLTSDAPARAAEASSALGMAYPVAVDRDGATASAYGVRALPTVFVIDKRGVVRDVVVGFDPARHRQLEEELQALLAEPSPAAP